DERTEGTFVESLPIPLEHAPSGPRTPPATALGPGSALTPAGAPLPDAPTGIAPACGRHWRSRGDARRNERLAESVAVLQCNVSRWPHRSRMPRACAAGATR